MIIFVYWTFFQLRFDIDQFNMRLCLNMLKCILNIPLCLLDLMQIATYPAFWAFELATVCTLRSVQCSASHHSFAQYSIFIKHRLQNPEGLDYCYFPLPRNPKIVSSNVSVYLVTYKVPGDKLLNSKRWMFLPLLPSLFQQFIRSCHFTFPGCPAVPIGGYGRRKLLFLTTQGFKQFNFNKSFVYFL